MNATLAPRGAALIGTDPHRLGHHSNAGDGDQPPRVPGRGDGGPADKAVVVGFGFWVFLLSDIVMFSAIFAAYAVLMTATDGGPGPHQVLSIDNAWSETLALLFSSFTCGLATIAAQQRSRVWTQVFLIATGVLGLLFLSLELRELAGLIAQERDLIAPASLSAFFMLVGCHGVHVTAGLIWLAVMLAQVATLGFVPAVSRRLMCFGLFWHALDIIWVALFTIVYLMGAH